MSRGNFNRKEGLKNPNYRHGEAMNGYSDLYRVWDNMMQRVYNPKNTAYKNYGGRGITVCEEWHDKKVFFLWAKNNGYKKNLQLDRENNDSNYSPENCRFVTCETNASNKRRKFDYGIHLTRSGNYEITIRKNNILYYGGKANNLEIARIKRDELQQRINKIITKLL